MREDHDPHDQEQEQMLALEYVSPVTIQEIGRAHV